MDGLPEFPFIALPKLKLPGSEVRIVLDEDGRTTRAYRIATTQGVPDPTHRVDS